MVALPLATGTLVFLLGAAVILRARLAMTARIDWAARAV